MDFSITMWQDKLFNITKFGKIPDFILVYKIKINTYTITYNFYSNAENCICEYNITRLMYFTP